MSKYDHAYTIGFSVISDQEDAEDVTSEMLRAALMKRIAGLDASTVDNSETFLMACDAPYDTFEIEEPLSDEAVHVALRSGDIE